MASCDEVSVGMTEGDDHEPITPGSARRPRLSRVSFSKETLSVEAPPRPHAKTWVDRYKTREATWTVFRERLRCGTDLRATANSYGRVATWSRKGGEADGVMWYTCCVCLGSCMIEQQRQAMEMKLHRWHKERGDRAAQGEPRLDAHIGSGGCCSLRWWPCTRAWLVAENVGALANFKAVQGLDGWPARNNWNSSPDVRKRAEARRADEVEMQPAPPQGDEMERDGGESRLGSRDDQEVDPLVSRQPPLGGSGAGSVAGSPAHR